MKPILKKAIEDTFTTPIDLKQLKILEKMKEEDPKIVISNPREIKLKSYVN